ncbi:MAG: hypothetical protein A2Y12_09430 [Planctomycetes bacterium GWF2_42_9]|nr:MAG: hypothetical protein A2Y12_09430 [Planctomycetes bacterium GWF2_42_9]
MPIFEKPKGLAKRIQHDFLESGRFVPGSKLPTVAQLATKYKVSSTTIRKAAEELVDNGCLSTRRGSGMYIEALPRVQIGYVAVDLHSPLPSNILNGINRVAKSRGCDLVVSGSTSSAQEERSHISTMINQGVKGVVVYCVNAVGRDSRDDYLAKEFRDFPIVVVDIYSPVMRRPHVIMDNEYAGYDMAQYLLGQNRRKIAFLKFDKIFSRATQDRLTGYKKALEEANLPLNPDYLVNCDSLNSIADIQEMLKNLVYVQPRPDAIIALMDEMVPLAIKSLRNLGLSVPEDIVVAGFDNLHNNFTNDIWPTTKSDFTLMGERAAEMLLERIASGDLTPSGIVLPCSMLPPEQQRTCDVKMRFGPKCLVL